MNTNDLVIDLVIRNNNYLFYQGKVAGSTGITVEMVRRAVEELMMKRAGVSAKMIFKYLKTRYPIEKNPSLLKKELKDKLDHAVTLGILSRSETDTYCLGTFRQKAYNYKTDLSSFWERYYKVILFMFYIFFN